MSRLGGVSRQLSAARQPRVGDSHTITTVCALRCLPEPLNPETLVVIELKLPQNKPVTRQLGGLGIVQSAHLEVRLSLSLWGG